jgi:Yip1 domain
MLEGRVLARCPSCRNTFSTERPGRQDCPVCGKPLVVPDLPPVEASAPGDATGPDVSGHPAPPGTPWERRSELGFVKAWASTVSQALFEPSRLFRAVRIENGGAHVGFAVLTTSTFAILNELIGRVAVSPERVRGMLSAGQLPAGVDVDRLLSFLYPSTPWFIARLVATPILVLAAVYLSALVTHGFALLLRQSKRGFAATLAASAYGFAPAVLFAVPACGGIIAVVWIAVLTGIGLKQLHGIGSGGAAASVLLPYALICCGGCGVLFVVASAMMRTMAQ